jgi:hypothetical protein
MSNGFSCPLAYVRLRRSEEAINNFFIIVNDPQDTCNYKTGTQNFLNGL